MGFAACRNKIFISDIGMTPFYTNSIAHFKREGMPVLAFFPAIQ